MQALTPEDDHWCNEILKVHAHKLRNVRPTEDDRHVHLLHANQDRKIGLHAPFVQYTRDEAVRALNTSLRSVQWLLGQQIIEYDASRRLLAGVLLSSGEVLVQEIRLQPRPTKTSGFSSLLR